MAGLFMAALWAAKNRHEIRELAELARAQLADPDAPPPPRPEGGQVGRERAGRRPPVARPGDPLPARGAVLWSQSPAAPVPTGAPDLSVWHTSTHDVGVTDAGAPVAMELPALTAPEAAELLMGLYRVNLRQLAGGEAPITPKLLSGEIRYHSDGRTRLATIRDLHRQGYGDCAPFAAAVAAEMTREGKPAIPYVYFARPGLFHAVVRELETGNLYDPSRTAGMGAQGA